MGERGKDLVSNPAVLGSASHFIVRGIEINIRVTWGDVQEQVNLHRQRPQRSTGNH